MQFAQPESTVTCKGHASGKLSERVASLLTVQPSFNAFHPNSMAASHLISISRLRFGHLSTRFSTARGESCQSIQPWAPVHSFLEVGHERHLLKRPHVQTRTSLELHGQRKPANSCLAFVEHLLAVRLARRSTLISIALASGLATRPRGSIAVPKERNSGLSMTNLSCSRVARCPRWRCWIRLHHACRPGIHAAAQPFEVALQCPG